MNLHNILAMEIKSYHRNIIETGTIRDAEETGRIGDGWSTQFFARHVREHAGCLVSIDLNIKATPQVLSRSEMDCVQLVEGYSIAVLARLLEEQTRFDVAFLDSDNDPLLILHEFMIAEQLLAVPPSADI